MPGKVRETPTAFFVFRIEKALGACVVKRESGRIACQNKLQPSERLTDKRPHPVGTNARIDEKRSRNVRRVKTRQRVMTTMAAMNASALTRRNMSWKSALKRLRPKDTILSRMRNATTTIHETAYTCTGGGRVKSKDTHKLTAVEGGVRYNKESGKSYI